MDAISSPGDIQSFSLEERPLAQCTDGAVPPCVGTESDSYFGHGAPVEGRSVRLNVRDGMDLLAHDVMLFADVSKGMAADPCLAITLLLEADGYGVIVDPDSGEPLSGPIAYAPSALYVSFSTQRLSGQSWAPAASRYRLVEFRLSHAFLARLNVWDRLVGLKADHHMHHASGAGYWVGMTHADADFVGLAEQIHAAAFVGAGNDLALDARGLDFLSATFRLLDRKEPPNGEQLPARVSARIMAATRQIHRDPAHPWTLRELARAVGLTEKRLKQGFRSHLGTTVISYLQKERLRVGRMLVQNGDAAVTEISLKVGYANPSHFARLYRASFGESPSETRRRC